MAKDVGVAGAASRTGARLSIEETVFEVVNAALEDAKLRLADVDFVVTTGSDTLDAGMVATRSGIAGSYGKQLLTVPSSAGHAFAAALSLLQSGQSETLLLAGWGEGTKFGDLDGRGLQADPFYVRPLGADARKMVALQTQRLLADGRISAAALNAYGAEMDRRAGAAVPRSSGMAGWLDPCWADGAAAIILTTKAGQARVAGMGSHFNPYVPDGVALDPAAWIEHAMKSLPRTIPRSVEIAAPNAIIECAALAAFGAESFDASAKTINAGGGGAAAHFGPATGLRSIAAAFSAAAGGRCAAIACDLAGPIGQAVSVIAIDGASP